MAITRWEEGGREVPVAISVRLGEEAVRVKKRVGTDPQVSGAINVAIADRPGCRKRSNL